MSLVVRIAGGVAVFLIAFFVTLTIIDRSESRSSASRCNARGNTLLAKPYAKESGEAWYVQIPELADLGDGLATPNRSPLWVCENGIPLGPAHGPVDDVRASGKGRFVHWGGVLFFTASDNSDPNTNGRRYELVNPAAR